MTRGNAMRRAICQYNASSHDAHYRIQDDQKKSCSQVLTRCVIRSTPGDDMRLRPPAETAAP
jgi:hypothetical protein